MPAPGKWGCCKISRWLLCDCQISLKHSNGSTDNIENGDINQDLILWLLAYISWHRGHFVYVPVNERRRYNVTSSLIGWAHTQKYTSWQYYTSKAIQIRTRGKRWTQKDTPYYGWPMGCWVSWPQLKIEDKRGTTNDNSEQNVRSRDRYRLTVVFPGQHWFR